MHPVSQITQYLGDKLCWLLASKWCLDEWNWWSSWGDTCKRPLNGTKTRFLFFIMHQAGHFCSWNWILLQSPHSYLSKDTLITQFCPFSAEILQKHFWTDWNTGTPRKKYLYLHEFLSVFYDLCTPEELWVTSFSLRITYLVVEALCCRESAQPPKREIQCRFPSGTSPPPSPISAVLELPLDASPRCKVAII